LQHRLDNQDGPPRYVIQEIQIGGTAMDRQAELTAEFSIDVRDAGWVRVPLRLGQAILLKEAEYEGSGEQLLEFENQQEGYVSWIRSEPGKAHKIKLKLLVPLTTIGGETQLTLNLPRAPLGKLDLLVAAASIQAKVSEGSELVQTEQTADGKTRLKALRIGGDFELAWHASDSHVANVPPCWRPPDSFWYGSMAGTSIPRPAWRCAVLAGVGRSTDSGCVCRLVPS